MFSLKNLDLFRKSDQTRSTVIGGLVSIFSLIVSIHWLFQRVYTVHRPFGVDSSD